MQYDLSTKTNSVYRTRGLDNLLRMGHCAPAVMQTVLDINHTQREDLVRLVAGMPGGIGDTGFECGGITSPLVLLGLRHGLREMHDGLPRIFDLDHAYYQRFSDVKVRSGQVALTKMFASLKRVTPRSTIRLTTHMVRSMDTTPQASSAT